MPTRAKICGISRQDALDAAIAADAAMVGFLHYPASPRHIEPEAAASLRVRLPDHISAVAVGVDMEDALLERLATELRPDFFQLHGQETPQRVAAIRERFGIPTIKAISVRSAADIAAANAYQDSADMLLLDGCGTELPGGNGITFDWSLLAAFPSESDNWILSGGLDPENVAEAIAHTSAPYVDVSSGVESAPGRKDPSRIAAFLRAVGQAQTKEAA